MSCLHKYFSDFQQLLQEQYTKVDYEQINNLISDINQLCDNLYSEIISTQSIKLIKLLNIRVKLYSFMFTDSIYNFDENMSEFSSFLLSFDDLFWKQTKTEQLFELRNNIINKLQQLMIKIMIK